MRKLTTAARPLAARGKTAMENSGGDAGRNAEMSVPDVREKNKLVSCNSF